MSDNFATDWQKTHEQLLTAYRQLVVPTADEMAALQVYVGIGYKYVSEYLWTGANANANHTRLVLDTVRYMDSLMVRSFLPMPLTTYHRAEVSSTYYAKMAAASVGDEYIATSFESTSINPYLGGHGRSVLATYKIPAGVRSLYVPAFASERSFVAMVENELLLDRGLHWLIASKQTGLDNSVSVVLELVSQADK